MYQLISEATRKNWDRLNTVDISRLTHRANKRLSLKRIVPVEYFANQNNKNAVYDILAFLDDPNNSIVDVLCTVAERLFDNIGILYNTNVQGVLAEYSYTRIEKLFLSDIPLDEIDLLGIVYQSSMMEGVKNQIGSYYTPYKVTSSMVSSLSFDQGQTFFDPCCGSGSFLLSLPCDDPKRLYGLDSDPIAVMITKFNLLLHYPHVDFTPNVICDDFLSDNPFSTHTFDYIVTNPPWGAFIGDTSGIAEISSQETFSLFFVKSYHQIKKNGIVRLLLPEAILNVKVHKDIRKFILDNCCLNSITVYDGLFSGVVTGFVDIECQKKHKSDVVRINKDDCSFDVHISAFLENENNVFCFLDALDIEIVNKCKSAGRYNLDTSIWALGVVTGDNKGKLKKTPAPGLEAIYTGKEVIPYGLKEAQNYIIYNRESFQQVAKEEYYRASEKLVYKFISNRLVFAYDNKQRLFLNSANILIPRIPGMNIKTVMALLNSDLFSFLYKKMFGEVKILKGNLLQLPFPSITVEQNRRISTLVDRIMEGYTDDIDVLQYEVYSLYDLSEDQIDHIRRLLYGKIS